jgi:hypothetical protein
MVLRKCTLSNFSPIKITRVSILEIFCCWCIADDISHETLIYIAYGTYNTTSRDPTVDSCTRFRLLDSGERIEDGTLERQITYLKDHATTPSVTLSWVENNLLCNVYLIFQISWSPLSLPEPFGSARSDMRQGKKHSRWICFPYTSHSDIVRVCTTHSLQPGEFFVSYPTTERPKKCASTMLTRTGL